MDIDKINIDWLQGVRVVLIGNYVPGPLAAYFLSMLGAEVIKVEQGQGDHLRWMGDQHGETTSSSSPMFRALNGGFKSISLQWRQPEGALILRQLLETADIIIDGNRKGVVESALGIPPQTISPHLIYIAITAYGQVGPMAQLGGHDNNILALAGNLSFTQRDSNGIPTVFSAPVADMFAGQMAAFGALAALIGRRDNTNICRTIDASMLHAGFFMNFLELANRNDKRIIAPQPGKAWMNGGRADYRPYLTLDHKHIFFGLIEPWALKRFLNAMGQSDLMTSSTNAELFAHRLQAMFLEKNQAEWVEIGAQLDACITPINDLEEAIQSPQIQALGLMQSVDDREWGMLELPAFPLGFGTDSQQPPLPKSAPLLGEHTAEILQRILGFNEKQLIQLAADGIIGLT